MHAHYWQRRVAQKKGKNTTRNDLYMLPVNIPPTAWPTHWKRQTPFTFKISPTPPRGALGWMGPGPTRRPVPAKRKRKHLFLLPRTASPRAAGPQAPLGGGGSGRRARPGTERCCSGTPVPPCRPGAALPAEDRPEGGRAPAARLTTRAGPDPPPPGTAPQERRRRTLPSSPPGLLPAAALPTPHTQAGSGGRRRTSRSPRTPPARSLASPLRPPPAAQRRPGRAPSPAAAGARRGALTSGCRMGTQPASFSYSSRGAAILVRARRPLHAG